MPNLLSLFVIDDDLYASTRCPYCDRVIKNNCEIEVAELLIEQGVKLFNWNDGDTIE
jgi:hypothetical protein